MIIAGSDHAGFRLKERLKTYLLGRGKEVLDLGVHSEESANYAPVAQAVCRKVLEEPGQHVGLLVCGSGNGMAMAANRFPGIRAALCASVELARLARAHNDANVLVLAGRFLPPEDAGDIVDMFLATPFEGGRHETRIVEIDSGCGA